MNGFINVNKPSGMSSAYVISKIKRAVFSKFGKIKIGHMGTLDPLASGVLPVAIGKSTKLFDYLLDKQKTYVAEFTFGYETDTLDREGKIIKENGRIPSIKEIENIIPKHIGLINQLPPIYSAKRVNGVRSYDLARQGKEVELNRKEVVINSISVEPIDGVTFKFYINCGGGTYIRSICRDIAYSLNTVATMTKLIRTSSGIFTLENAQSLDEINNGLLNVIPSENVVPYKRIDINEEMFKDILNGKDVKVDLASGLYNVFLNGKYVILGEVKNSYIYIGVFLGGDN